MYLWLHFNVADLMEINEKKKGFLRRVFPEQMILCYKFDRKSIYDCDHLGLDHPTFRSCTLPASLQLMIGLWFNATGYVSLKCHT